MAVFQPQGGLLTPERCVLAHVRLAEAQGAEVHTGERVLGWEILPDDRIGLRSEAGEYRAEKLVI